MTAAEMEDERLAFRRQLEEEEAAGKVYEHEVRGLNTFKLSRRISGLSLMCVMVVKCTTSLHHHQPNSAPSTSRTMFDLNVGATLARPTPPHSHTSTPLPLQEVDLEELMDDEQRAEAKSARAEQQLRSEPSTSTGGNAPAPPPGFSAPIQGKAYDELVNEVCLCVRLRQGGVYEEDMCLPAMLFRHNGPAAR